MNVAIRPESSWERSPPKIGSKAPGHHPARRKRCPLARAIDGKEVPAENPDDRVSGEYKRVNKTGSFDRDIAVLDLWLLKNGKVRVLGYSSWVDRKSTRLNSSHLGISY